MIADRSGYRWAAGAIINHARIAARCSNSLLPVAMRASVPLPVPVRDGAWSLGHVAAVPNSFDTVTLLCDAQAAIGQPQCWQVL